MSQWHEISANRRALGYILFSVIVLGAMVIGGIAPVKKETAAIERKAAGLEAQIQKQKILQPIYLRLVETQQRINDLKENLPDAQWRNDFNFDINTSPGVLSDMAGDAGVAESRFLPVPESVASDTDLLLIEGTLQGEYVDFRSFLIKLADFPAFHSIESLAARSTETLPEYSVRIWMDAK